MSTLINQSPLGIFVLWHPNFNEGQSYANLIFSEFKRNVNNPLSRGMNIPVYFRYQKPLLKISFNDYKVVVIIALIDSNFVIDQEFTGFIQDVGLNNNHLLIIPVAINPSAFNAGLGKTNMARLYEKSRKELSLINIVAHEVVRHLYGIKDEFNESGRPSNPLKLFISHAKADGLEIASQIKLYIESKLPLKTFFDANDIAIGYDFSKEIEDNIKESVLIAVHTDLYSTREWCRKEILLAKENNRPIIVLNSLKNGESRSFPYMANVLTVHFPSVSDGKLIDTNDVEILVTMILKETLRLKYHELLLEYIKHTKGTTNFNRASISGYPPELVTVLKRKSKLKGEYIYPDPPLGKEEMEILIAFDSGIRYLTPIDL